MANIIITGASFAFASTYGANATASAITTAANAVATSTTLAAVVGDFVEFVSSGWGRAERRVFRVSVVTGDDFTLEGLDTTDTNLFPTGGGASSVLRRITAFTTLTQVARAIEIDGNELETEDATYISDVIRKNIPIFRSATDITLPIFFDPSLPWVGAAKAASDANAIRALRAIWPGGARTIFNGYLSYGEAPNIEGSVLRTSVNILGVSVPTTYST